jgi:hypothetical protein
MIIAAYAAASAFSTAAERVDWEPVAKREFLLRNTMRCRIARTSGRWRV